MYGPEVLITRRIAAYILPCNSSNQAIYNMWSRLWPRPAKSSSNLAFSLWQPLRTYAKPPRSETQYEKRIRESDREYAKNAPTWVKRDQSLKKRYGSWNPSRKLTRQQIADIREIKQRLPTLKTVQIADVFQVNPESIRRILKSKWTPTETELEDIELRTEKRKAQKRENRLAEKSATPSRSSTVVKVHGFLAQRQIDQKKLVEKTQPKGRKKRDNDRRGTYTKTVGDLID